jgi:hypothetical protein
VQVGNAEQVFPVFAGVWLALGLVSAGFLFLSKNVRLKRRLWPPFLVLTGVLFVGFTWAMGAVPGQGMLVVVPLVALIIYLNLRAVQFCDSCGVTVLSQNPFSRPAFCSKCGARLSRDA